MNLKEFSLAVVEWKPLKTPEESGLDPKEFG
jgi:hypothetical protein